MMNHEQIEASSATEWHPSNVGLTKPVLESGKTAGSIKIPFELREIFNNALRNATTDEIGDCLRESARRLYEHPSEVEDWKMGRCLQELNRRCKNASTHNITVQEAIRFADHCTYKEIVLAYHIAKAYRRVNPPVMASAQYGVCFHAGMVEGIRRERARRRRRRSNQAPSMPGAREKDGANQ